MSIWKKSYKISDLGVESFAGTSSWGLAPLFKDVLESNNDCLYEFSESGSAKENIDYYLNKIKELKFRLVYKYVHESWHSHIFITEDSMLEFSFDSTSENVTVKGYSKNEEMLRELGKYFKNTFKPVIRQGFIFAITNSGGRLSLSNIGNAGEKLIEGNYVPDVISDYKEAIVDLRAASPSGRIVIMEGTPGTGKTFLVKSFLTSVPDAMFVLISPEMVSSLDGPELLPLLLSNKISYCPNGPIVLILEDADKCLVKRGSDNMNSIQSLLNLSDGILGTMLDLRIIATTNAKKLEIEPAILRPGRLSKRIEVGPLDFNTARDIFKRLLPDAVLPDILSKEPSSSLRGPDFNMTLAEVYSLARKHGWVPSERDMSVKDNSFENDYNDDYDD